ncbi:deoxycytidylate deaminase [Priestia megaterium]
MVRKSWNQYFMEQAEKVNERATCNRLAVGCVLVRDNRIIGSGYNGSITGHEHCTEKGCLEVEENGKVGCKRTIHAEHNAILQCAKYGVPTEGAVAFVTHYPCPDCMKTLNQAGIKKVYYKHYYKHRYDNDFNKGMEIIQYEKD